MNYRQWKKNYKKKHGVNPPLSEDKRKQVKVMKKNISSIAIPDLQTAARNAAKVIVNTVGEFYVAIGKVFTDLGNYLRSE